MAETMTLETPSNKNFAKVSVTRGSQELSRKDRRTRINELLYFIPSAVLKQLTPKQLETKLVAHRCAICEKVFCLTKGVQGHKEDAHGIKHDQAASPATPAIKTVTPKTPATKRRPKHRLLREKHVFSYDDNFYCDYECGFSTEDIVTMSNHIKTHHAERATTKHRDENGNIDLPRQQRSSDLNFTDETIPEPSQASSIQEAGNKEEAIIVISDDKEEVATPKTTETDENCREFMSSGVCSTTDKWVDEEALETMESLTPIDELFSSSDGDQDDIDDLSKKNKRSMDNVDNEDASKLAKFCINATNDKSQYLDSDNDDILECYMLVNGVLYEIADS